MASHQLAIAKATFAASLLRPDPVGSSISRDKVDEFHQLLDAAIARCSPQNIQTCREWLSRNLVPSKARVSALGKYLAVLSTSFADQSDAKSTSSPRRRLHILYLLNDVLHWLKFHQPDSSRLNAFIDGIEHHLVLLIDSVSAFESSKKRHHDRVADLLSIWAENQYISEHLLGALQTSAQSAKSRGGAVIPEQPTIDANGAPDHKVADKQRPWLMPATHGDPETPYYDLPAANMIPHIIPNSGRAIGSKQIKPLQLVPGPAEERLTAAVSAFLSDVEILYSVQQDDEAGIADIDEMGQELILDELDERVDGETYYGWSRSFAKKMQRRGKDSDTLKQRSSRGRGRSLSDSRGSRSFSRSRSRSPRKRRRSLSSSGSRSRSPRRRREAYTRSPYGSRSRSRGTSQSPRRYHDRSRSKSPARHSSPPRSNISFDARQPAPPPAGHAFPFAPPIASSIPTPPIGLPMAQNGMPVPPPRPPHWTGPWPPPPPPIAAFNHQMPMPAPGFVPPPPPNFNHGMQNLPPGMYSTPPVPPPPPMAQGNWNMPGGRGGYGGSRGRGYGR